MGIKQQKTKNKTTFGVKLLLIMIFIYIFLYFYGYTKYLALEAFFGTLGMLIKILPLLVFVFFISLAVNLFLKPDVARKHLGENSGFKGLAYAMIAGILVSGPPYILYPLLKEMKDSGVSDRLLAVFLYNRNVKIPFIPVMIYYFGWAFTIIISIYIIIFSVLNGFIIEKIVKKA